ncbi:MAG: ABC transporter substrate-binding protein [Anaerolineales bacterium]|nr:ABC transporter substrate-binding protein [Anaerolineales bacterium]
MLDKHNLQGKSQKVWTLLTWMMVITLLLSGCGTEKPRVYRVGIISGSEAFATIADGFKAGMTELGYVEGENIVYDVQQPNPDPAEWQRVAEQFVADEVDLIFVFPHVTALPAKTVTQGTDIPVIFALGTVEMGDLVDSVRQPGGNITGVRFPLPENMGKRLEILHEIAPQAKRVLVEYDSTYPHAPFALEALRLAASSAGVTLVEEPAVSVAELQANLQARAALDDIGIDAILIMPEVNSQTPEGFAAIAAFADEHNVPIAGALSFTADHGAIFSFVSDNFEMGELAASLADKVFKGTSAGTIPVATPEQYLRINYKKTQLLGLTVPEGLMKQAAEIIR